MQISLNFQTSCYNLKNRDLEAKQCVAFKIKKSVLLLNNNLNFNKNETKSKMENPPHTVREMNLELHLL